MRHMWTLKIKNNNNWFTIESLVNWKSMHSTTALWKYIPKTQSTLTETKTARTHTHTHAEPCSLFQNVILSTLWLYSLKHANILGALHTNTWPSQVYFIFCLVLYFFRRPTKIKSKSRELGPFETTEFAVRRWFETNPILAGCGL